MSDFHMIGKSSKQAHQKEEPLLATETGQGLERVGRLGHRGLERRESGRNVPAGTHVLRRLALVDWRGISQTGILLVLHRDGCP